MTIESTNADEGVSGGEKIVILEKFSSVVSNPDLLDDALLSLEKLTLEERSEARKNLGHFLFRENILTNKGEHSQKILEKLSAVFSPETMQEAIASALYTIAEKDLVEDFHLNKLTEAENNLSLSHEELEKMLYKAKEVFVADVVKKFEDDLAPLKGDYESRVSKAVSEEERSALETKLKEILLEDEKVRSHILEEVSSGFDQKISSIMNKITG